MNPWQVAYQLRHLLRLAAWADGSAELVFGTRVYVAAAPAGELLAANRAPFAVVIPGSADADVHEPRLWRARFEVLVVTAVTGDTFGEAVLLGGPRSGGQGSSRGRGLLELEEVTLGAVERLDGESGIRMRVVAQSAVAPAPIPGTVAAQRSYTVEAWCSRSRSYEAPRLLAATASGGGAVALTWSLPAARYDRRRVVLRRASGSTAPSSATAGTGVTLSGDLATSHADTPGAGTWSYALFGAYDETGSGSDERYSSGVTATVVAT